MRKVISCFTILCHLGDVFALNSSSMLPWTYPKAAKWGAAHSHTNKEQTIPVEGRGNRGQTFYTQRSDVNLRIGQNLDQQSSKVGIPHGISMKNARSESPGKINGFQDRFNPPPIFAFNGDESKRDIPYRNDDGIRTPTYDSPITSYNPAPSGVPESGLRFHFSGPTFPPNLAPVYKGPVYTYSETTRNVKNDSSNPVKVSNGFNYLPSLDSPTVNKPTTKSVPHSPLYGPLDLPSKTDNYDHHDSASFHQFKFPSYVYDSNSSDPILNHSPAPPQEEYPFEESPEEGHLPEYFVHSAPLGKFAPHFEYDEHDHIPHEFHHQMTPVTTTTTTTTQAPAKEEKRVNKGHYSYYYLGRKLYYIPLYFSVYFIIYVTVLILKSISRHKVNFAHDLHEAASNRRLQDDFQDLEDATERARTAISSFAKRYV